MLPEPSTGKEELSWALPLLLVALLWAFAFPSLDQYNVSWDEALGDLFFGERYLSYYTSFDPAYLEFAEDPYPEGHSPDLGLSPFRRIPWEYYPFANTLAAATSEILSRQLGWLDAFDGFHAFNLLVAALFIVVFFRFLAVRFGLVSATAAIGFLFTSPRVFSHMMANIKDFPLMVFFTFTLLAFLHAFERGSPRGLLLAGALWGTTLAVKANALFLPFVVLFTIFPGRLPETWFPRKTRLLATLTGGGILGGIVLIASWPYLWADPLVRLRQHFDYIAFREGYTRPESIAPVLEAIGFTTPLVFLAFLLIGLVPCLQRARRGDRASRMLLVWIAVVLGRFLPPQAVNFDGVRHFLELFPALAAVAGVGVAVVGSRLADLVGTAIPGRRLKAMFLMAVLLPGTWATLRTHPFQLVYWNSLVGGYPGARARGLPQASDYWGKSYRLGLEWLNENAMPNSLLAVPVVEHAVRLVAPLRLREDITLLPVSTPLSPKIAPERLRLTREASLTRPLYVMFVDRRDWTNELMEDCLLHLEPLVVWEQDGAPVLSIYLYQPPSGAL